MDLKEPVVVYTAPTNLEAHVVVSMLTANEIPAYAVEDQSGASIWMLGTITQFHRPKVYVDKSDVEAALQLVLEFEERQRERNRPGTSTEQVEVRCEECGASTMFPAAQSGTVQDCPKCHAYVDVGEIKWDENFEATEEP